MTLIERQAVGPAFKNGFIVSCDRTREAVLIDPGDEIEGLLAVAEGRALAIKWILLTHAHIDHITGVPAAKKALGVPIYLHRDDLFLYERGADQAEMYGFHLDPLPPVDQFYKPGDVFTFGEHEVRWHHTPGHCPGGVCLQVGSACGPREESESSSAAARASGGGAPRALIDDLFVGDTLFAGSIGRTDFAGGNLETLMASIRNVLFAFGDDARVHPGHGPSTTIGRERRTNPFVMERA